MFDETPDHKPEFAGIWCPLCGDFGADKYNDHGGLCVCQSCRCTFDPELDKRGAVQPIRSDDEIKADWKEHNKRDERDRRRLRRLETTRVREAFRNTDGLRRLRGIPADEWARAVEKDEREGL